MSNAPGANAYRIEAMDERRGRIEVENLLCAIVMAHIRDQLMDTPLTEALEYIMERRYRWTFLEVVRVLEG